MSIGSSGSIDELSSLRVFHNTKGTLDYLHSDLWGPSNVPSNGGVNYMLSIIDDFSKSVWSFFLKHKSDVFATFEELKIMIKDQIEKQIKSLPNDNSLEFFFSDEFDALCKLEGIVRHHKVIGTPQQNGVAKRMNKTIIEKVHCMLSNAKLSKSFGLKRLRRLVFPINRSLLVSIDKKTQIKVWSNTPSIYFDLKIFGCLAYARVDNGKLEPNYVKCVFLSYNNGVKGYKLWFHETRKIIVSRDFIFYETAMLQDLPSNNSCDTSQHKSRMQMVL